MCGISGIFSDKPFNSELVEDSIHQIAHRGPDEKGFFYHQKCVLGMCRLSIIDVASGQQPSYNENRDIVSVFNGEIYNFIEIRNELITLGYTFKSETDTEVILASYDYWGFDCVSRFNGMWGFAILDKAKNILFCSRDRFGVKPFYYSVCDDKFVFGSEIKQILSMLPETIANQNILMEYLILGMIDHRNTTFFEGVNRLPASHNLVYDLAKLEFKIIMTLFRKHTIT